MHSFWMQAQITTDFIQPIASEKQAATLQVGWKHSKLGGERETEKQSFVLSIPNKISKCQKQQVASEWFFCLIEIYCYFRNIYLPLQCSHRDYYKTMPLPNFVYILLWEFRGICIPLLLSKIKFIEHLREEDFYSTSWVHLWHSHDAYAIKVLLQECSSRLRLTRNHFGYAVAKWMN